MLKNNLKVLVILAGILLMNGCSNKLGIEQVMKDSISEDRQITQVISNRSQLKSDTLKKELFNKIQTNFDFSKYSILIYTVREASICDYDEKFVKKDAQQVDIMLIDSKNPNAICMEASINYYFAYKISKKIKKVGLKLFKHEYVVVEIK